MLSFSCAWSRLNEYDPHKKVTSLDTITSPCFTNWLLHYALFSHASFWHHQSVTITSSCFTSWLSHYALFSHASFWHHQSVTSWLLHYALFSHASFWHHLSVFGIMDRTPEGLSLGYRSWKKCMGIAIILPLIIFYLCVVNFWWHTAVF